MIGTIFSIPILSKTLNLNLDEITRYCLEFKQNTPTVNISNIGGWQSSFLEGEHKHLNELFKCIMSAAEEYREVIQYKHPLKIKSLWININNYKDYNTEHAHQNTVASGVFYVKAKSGNLIFCNPAGNVMEYDWSRSNLNKYNSYNCSNIESIPENNKLLIFPGWLVHKVGPNLYKEDRISISFNLCR